MDNMQKNIIIVGLGNPLMGDDGVGIFIINKLEEFPFPPHIKIVDCGTDVLKILSHIEGQEWILLIDAIEGKHPTGTIYRFSKEELLNFPGESKSAHLISVIDSLRLLEKLNSDFRKAVVEMIGIQPGKIEVNTPLSPPVEKAAREVIREIKDRYFTPGSTKMVP